MDLDAHMLQHMVEIERKLDDEIGFGWWKRYIASAFWSNIATPLNLSITLMTALTTAQATSDKGLLPQKAYEGLSIATLVISVLNTFFRPHALMNENYKLVTKWWELGNKLEEIHYKPKITPDDIAARYNEYIELQKEVNAHEISQSLEVQNFLTDLIHVIANKTVLRGRGNWLVKSQDARTQTNSQNVSMDGNVREVLIN
jgi:hypothetical protein